MTYCKERKGIVTLMENGMATMVAAKLTIRVTNDGIRKTMSISDERCGVMLQVNVEDIAEEIREVLK